MKPAWVSVKDAIQMLGLCRTTVYRLIRNGSLASVTVGRKRLVFAKSIEELGQGQGADGHVDTKPRRP